MKQLNGANAGLTDHRPIRILQFGGGNFLRAFFDWMVDILNEKTSFHGDVVLVKPTDGSSYQALINQDCLYHTILQDSSGEVARLINCIQKTVHPYSDWDEFMNTASLPDCRFVVSNTTESGICYEFVDWKEDQVPSSFPAKLAHWLFRRFKVFNGDPSKGMIILPTELIEDNGKNLRTDILQHAEDWKLPKGFTEWIKNSNYFCNTLVDRIVSGFPEQNYQQIQQGLGFYDQQIVVGENYHQWVIESSVDIQQELPFSETELNVTLTDDLRPYRESKVRILNGAHTALVPIGLQAGLSTVYEVMSDGQLGPFIEDLMLTEIVPTFTDNSIDPESFAQETISRFKNPFINHQLKSISANCVKKFQVRLIPTIGLYLEKFNAYPSKIMFCWAALIHMEIGASIEVSLFEDWDLMALEREAVVNLLQVDLNNIELHGLRKAAKLVEKNH